MSHVSHVLRHHMRVFNNIKYKAYANTERHKEDGSDLNIGKSIDDDNSK